MDSEATDWHVAIGSDGIKAKKPSKIWTGVLSLLSQHPHPCWHWNNVASARGAWGSFGRSVYTWVSSDVVYTVPGSVFYLLVKYQRHKERNSTKSTILTLHIPTITAEITQQFLSYMSAKKASATNHLFFCWCFFSFFFWQFYILKIVNAVLFFLNKTC